MELEISEREGNSRGMPVQLPIRVWALLGPHRGDNNQVLALARELGFPFEEKRLDYNRLRSLQPWLLGASLSSVEKDSRRLLDGDPPDLTISTGHRSVPVVRALRRRSGGRMRAVHLGYPRISPRHFDLVVATPEYPIEDAPQLMRIPFALSPHSAPSTIADDAALKSLPRPHLLFVLGGPTLYWELPISEMRETVAKLIARAKGNGGSVLAVGSPRTPDALLHMIRDDLDLAEVPTLVAPSEGSPSYAALIHDADSIFVTADSVAMVADAVTTGKPVGIVPIANSAAGGAVMGVMDRLRPGKRLFPRDLRFFWAALQEQGLGGTVDAPRASDAPDYVAIVADRVRQLFAPSGLPARNDRDSVRRERVNPAGRDRA